MENGFQYIIRSGVKGMLLEINENLASNPQLLLEKVSQNIDEFANLQFISKSLRIQKKLLKI